MTKITNDRSVTKLLEALKGLFSEEQAFLLPRRHMSFVCGAKDELGTVGSSSLRKQFLDYLSENDDENLILPILAEKAIQEFLAAKTDTALDLGSFESLIANCVDSILIFPESPGSFAELGFFAAMPDVIAKTLVANLDAYQGNSFINLGLMPFYNSDSVYKPMIIIGKNVSEGFAQVQERLLINNSSTRYRKRFPEEEFKAHSPKNQLIALYELMRAFGYLTEENLFRVIPLVFGAYDLVIVHRLLAILVAMRYVRRNEHGDYLVQNSAPSLLEYKNDLFDKARTQVRLYYDKHDKEAYSQLEGLL